MGLAHFGFVDRGRECGVCASPSESGATVLPILFQLLSQTIRYGPRTPVPYAICPWSIRQGTLMA